MARDEGIVLRRRTYGDADRILVVFTQARGKLSLLAKGARRARARNAPGLDLLARSELLLIPGRQLAVLAQARPLGPPWPAQDPVRTACGAVLAELADAILEEGQAEPELYGLVAEARDRMAVAQGEAQTELAIAALQIAASGGDLPAVTRCAGWGAARRDRQGGVVPPLGGVVQGRCWEQAPGALACSGASLKVLRRLELGDLELVRRLRWTEAVRNELESILLAHLEHHLDKPLRAARVLTELRASLPRATS